MSTPVTFSGFNNIDFNLVLTSLMQQASVPLTSLQTQQKALQTQSTNLDKLSALVASVRSAADALSKPSNTTMIAGTSSNEQAVSISTTTAAAAGTYDVVVNELAHAQVTVSQSTALDATSTIVADGGSLTIGGVTVSVGGASTLQQLADAINGTAGIGVSATVIRTGTSAYRIALTGTNSGAANAFTITNALTGGTGVSFTDTDQNGVSGDSTMDNAVTATDASILVNNIPVTNSSNVFADIVAGVTLTARKKDPATPVAVSVGTDTTAIKARIEEFVTAYNELAKFAGEQRASAATGDASSIGRHPMLRSLYNSLRGSIIGTHGAGTLTRFAEAGLELKRDGQMTLNGAAFDAAVAASVTDVIDLFSGAGGSFGEVKTLLDGYGQANGFIPAGKKQIEHQIDAMENQIAAMQRRLAIERESLQKQFAEADLMMSRLKSQASALSGFGGTGV